jgi:hypothetical protein
MRKHYFFVWPNCDVFYHQHMIYHLEGVLNTRGQVNAARATSIGISPRYYAQIQIFDFSVFSPCYCTVIQPNVSQFGSKNLEQHAYKVRSSKTVEL